MRAADALIFAILAIADFALMVYLRRRRGRRMVEKRMLRGLRHALQQDLNQPHRPLGRLRNRDKVRRPSPLAAGF